MERMISISEVAELFSAEIVSVYQGVKNAGIELRFVARADGGELTPNEIFITVSECLSLLKDQPAETQVRVRKTLVEHKIIKEDLVMEKKTEFRDHMYRTVLEDMLDHAHVYGKVRNFYWRTFASISDSEEADRLIDENVSTVSNFYDFVVGLVSAAFGDAWPDKSQIRAVVVLGLYEIGYRSGYVFTEDDYSLVNAFTEERETFYDLDCIFNVVRHLDGV